MSRTKQRQMRPATAVATTTIACSRNNRLFVAYYHFQHIEYNIFICCFLFRHFAHRAIRFVPIYSMSVCPLQHLFAERASDIAASACLPFVCTMRAK